MGWWGTGIMSGDSPLDFKGNFEDKFGSTDSEFNEWRVADGHEPVPFVKPDPSDAVKFITEFKWHWGTGDEHILKQVTGYLVMERGAPMNDELRALVISGIDEELADLEAEQTWNEPQERINSLNEFREAVVKYPSEGASVTMPASPGLFETIFERLAEEQKPG